MFNGVKVVLVLVVAGVVGGGALDLFIQFLFQLFVVLLCTPDVPILGRVSLDMNTGEMHFTSGWLDDDDDDF